MLWTLKWARPFGVKSQTQETKGKNGKLGLHSMKELLTSTQKGKQLKEESTYRIEENICELYS